MSEETPNTEQDQEPAPGTAPQDGEIDAEQVRKHKIFLSVAKHNKELSDRLDAIENAQTKAKEEDERKALEAKGEYETVLKQRDAEIERIKQEYAVEDLKRNISDALRDAGANNPVFIKGAVSEFTGTAEEIADFVKGLKENELNTAFFGEVKPAGQKALAHGAAGSRSNSKTLEERVADGDLDAMNEMLRGG